MTVDFVPVLQQMAATDSIGVTDLYIEKNLVFKRMDDVMSGRMYQISTLYWNAAKAAAQVLTRLQGQ